MHQEVLRGVYKGKPIVSIVGSDIANQEVLRGVIEAEPIVINCGGVMNQGVQRARLEFEALISITPGGILR